jgi:hypothetical protein
VVALIAAASLAWELAWELGARHKFSCGYAYAIIGVDELVGGIVSHIYRVLRRGMSRRSRCSIYDLVPANGFEQLYDWVDVYVSGVRGPVAFLFGLFAQYIPHIA